MKKIQISLAMLGLLFGSVASFAFKPKTMENACTNVSGRFPSDCKLLSAPICCHTAGGANYLGPLK
jgi:hypothetical protein